MTTKAPKAAFEFQVESIALDKLLPTRSGTEKRKPTTKYKALLASVQEVGIVEPINVYPQKGGKYLILDGHARVEVLRDLGKTEAPCLIAASDDAYTYNQQVSRIANVQATRMIVKALEAGVSAERVAKALNITVPTVRKKSQLVEGICPEAVDLLKVKPVSNAAFEVLKKVKPIRQIEIAELMAASGVYTATYARSLVMTTPKEHLVDPDDPKRIPGVKPEDLAKLEHEVRVQEKDFRVLDETYNENVMALTIARGYLRSLLENARVVRFLSQNSREFLTEFQRIAEATSLET